MFQFRSHVGLLILLFVCTSGRGIGQTYAAETGDAEVRSRTSDSSLTQEYQGHFGWKLSLPETKVAKFNKLGSKVNAAGQSEVVNFMLRGGKGGVTIKYYTEQRMIPIGFALLDSAIHFYEIDSAGRNGHIFRRTYVLTDQTIEIETMLTEKGQADLIDLVPAMFDSFQPPVSATLELEGWRYGRDPADYEEGRYPVGGGPEG